MKKSFPHEGTTSSLESMLGETTKNALGRNYSFPLLTLPHARVRQGPPPPALTGRARRCTVVPRRMGGARCLPCIPWKT